MTARISELRAALAVAQRDYEEGRAEVADGLHHGRGAADLARLCCRGIELAATQAEVARARRRATDAAEAVAEGHELHEQARRLVAEAPADVEAKAWLRTCAAELARADGTPAPEAWEAAAAAWEHLRFPYFRAYCQLRAAEAALAQRRPKSEVATLLRPAYATAVELTASPLAATIASVGRRARIDLEATAAAPRSSGRKPRESRHGLTGRELDVLQLVARGYTNPQIAQALFISPKTAEAHVSNILGKLGVGRRVEAAAVAERLDLLDEAQPLPYGDALDGRETG